jgi:hypothetical protein
MQMEASNAHVENENILREFDLREINYGRAHKTATEKLRTAYENKN